MNAQQKPKRTGVGVELVRLLAGQGDRIFTTARARQLAPKVGMKDAYVLEALHHLHRNGWIVPLRRGLYAISSLLPGVSPVHEFEIAMALVSPAAISHWSALHYHGLSEQVTHRVFVLTTIGSSLSRIRNEKAGRNNGGYPVGEAVYQFIQVKPERYFGVEKVWIGESRVMITDPERTLLDGLNMPKYCGDFGEVLHAFEERGPDLDINRIIAYALKLDAAAAKRLGWVLEHQGVDPAHLEPLARLSVKGYRKLDPSGPRKGPTNRRWMIQENLPGRISA